MHNTFFSVALFFGLAINAVFAEFAVSTPDIFAVCDSAPCYSIFIESASVSAKAQRLASHGNLPHPLTTCS